MFAVFLLFLTSLAGGSYLYWLNQDNVDTKIYDRYEFRADDTSGDSSITVGTVPIANAEGGVIPSLAVQRSSCPSGYTYNSANGMCEREVYNTSYYISCPSGFYYNSLTGYCERHSLCYGGWFCFMEYQEVSPNIIYYTSRYTVQEAPRRSVSTIRMQVR